MGADALAGGGAAGGGLRRGGPCLAGKDFGACGGAAAMAGVAAAVAVPGPVTSFLAETACGCGPVAPDWRAVSGWVRLKVLSRCSFLSTGMACFTAFSPVLGGGALVLGPRSSAGLEVAGASWRAGSEEGLGSAVRATVLGSGTEVRGLPGRVAWRRGSAVSRRGAGDAFRWPIAGAGGRRREPVCVGSSSVRRARTTLACWSGARI